MNITQGWVLRVRSRLVPLSAGETVPTRDF